MTTQTPMEQKYQSSLWCDGFSRNTPLPMDRWMFASVMVGSFGTAEIDEDVEFSVDVPLDGDLAGLAAREAMC